MNRPGSPWPPSGARDPMPPSIECHNNMLSSRYPTSKAQPTRQDRNRAPTPVTKRAPTRVSTSTPSPNSATRGSVTSYPPGTTRTHPTFTRYDAPDPVEPRPREILLASRARFACLPRVSGSTRCRPESLAYVGCELAPNMPRARRCPQNVRLGGCAFYSVGRGRGVGSAVPTYSRP